MKYETHAASIVVHVASIVGTDVKIDFISAETDVSYRRATSSH